VTLTEAAETAAQAATSEIEALDEPPPIRLVARAAPAAPRDGAAGEPAGPAGQRTQRTLRRMKSNVHRMPGRLALLAFAGALAFAWFSPAARGTAGTVWRRAEAQAHRLVASPVP
jgi:hypothetical protein